MSFRALHRPGHPLLMPNPWDAGSGAILAGLGFEALASTSAGAAFALGRCDGDLTARKLVEAAETIARAVQVPVSADLENCGDTHEDVRATVQAAADGLAGGSIEDFTGNPADPLYPLDEAVARVQIAVAAAAEAPSDFVLTARAEGRLHGADDLGAIIERLQAYEGVGADVLYAPGLRSLEEVKQVCKAVSAPVNVLVGALSEGFTVAALADAGVARISVGSALSRQALGGMMRFARVLLDDGRFDYDELAGFAEIEGLLPR